MINMVGPVHIGWKGTTISKKSFQKNHYTYALSQYLFALGFWNIEFEKSNLMN